MILPSNEFLKVFKETSGALSVTEAMAIMNLAAQAPDNIYLELGTHKGKSAQSACFTLKNKNPFYLLEPEFRSITWVEETKSGVDKILEMTKSLVIPIYCPEYSTSFINRFENYSWVFVDSGSHQDGLPMQEVKLLEDRMVQGGIIALHDWNSQFKEVKEASDYLVSTGKYEYIPINWPEIIEYVNANNLEEGNSSWHHTELKNPCFVGAVRRK